MLRSVLAALLIASCLTAQADTNSVWDWSAQDRDFSEHLSFRITPDGLNAILQNSIDAAILQGGPTKTFEIGSKEKITHVGAQGLGIDANRLGKAIDIVKTVFNVDLTQKIPYNVTVDPFLINGSWNGTSLSLKSATESGFSIRTKLNKEILYLEVHAPTVSAQISREDIDVKVLSATKDKIQLHASIQANALNVGASKFMLCQFEACPDAAGDRIVVNGVSIRQMEKVPVRIESDISIVFVNGKGSFVVENVTSNFDAKNVSARPRFALSWTGLELPDISMQFGDKIVPFRKDEMAKLLQEKRDELMRLLLLKVGAIVSSNVADRLNSLLGSVIVPSEYTRAWGHGLGFSFLADQPMPADVLDKSHYVHTPPEVIEHEKKEESALKPALDLINSLSFGGSLSIHPGVVMLDSNGVLKVGVAGSFVNNGTSFSPGTTLGHGKRTSTLGALSFSSAAKAPYHHFGLAISEPLVNAALSLPQSIAVLKKFIATKPGVSLGADGVKVHFADVGGKARVFVVVNLIVDVYATSTMGYLAEKWAGGDGIIKFPLELQFEPRIPDPRFNMASMLNPKSVLQFALIDTSINAEKKSVRNLYGYPYQWPKTAAVENGFFDSMSETVADLEKPIEIDLDALFSGLALGAYPDVFAVEPSGHFVVYGEFAPPVKKGQLK